MYKLFYDLGDGNNQVLYELKTTPHLWLLATNEKRVFDKMQFIDNLMTIASEINDSIFIDEITNMIMYLNDYDFKQVQISGPSCKPNIDELKAAVNDYEFENIFGTQINKIEYNGAETADEYFKEYRSNYRAQYRSVTQILVAINVGVFIVNILFGRSPFQFILLGGLVNPITWLTFILAGFTHLSFFHIFFNMTFLMSLGPSLENLLGKGRFLSLYFFSMIVSALFVFIFTNSPTAGASGALYGLFAFFICLTLKHETNQQQVQNVLSTFGINILFTLLTPGISVVGHLGGIVAGAIAFLIFNRQ